MFDKLREFLKDMFTPIGVQLAELEAKRAVASEFQRKTWPRPDDSESGADLSEDVLRFIYETSKCPYCHGHLYNGPRGGASLNMFCGGTCHARFNVVDPEFGFVPMGQFMGTAPQHFIDYVECGQ